MAKKDIEVSVDLTKPEAFELTRAIDMRLKELDQLFKACVKAESKAGMDGVAKSIAVVRDLRERVDGSPHSVESENE